MMLRRSNPKADSLSLTDLAALMGVSGSRLTQLRARMPDPDGGGSDARPRWLRETAARWLASEGRRLPPESASWLLPGPDGPHLRRRGPYRPPIRLQRRSSHYEEVTGQAPHAIGVHVAEYGDGPRRLWLVTPAAPATAYDLTPRGGDDDLWEHASPLGDLIAQLTEGEAPRHREEGGRSLLGTIVILPTARGTGSVGLRDEPDPADLRIVDVFDGWERGEEKDGELTRQMGQLRLDSAEDLAAALGHRLPYWPSGCNSLDLIAAYDPVAGKPVACAVPPPAEHAWAFLQLCKASAAAVGRESEVGAGLEALGGAYWGIYARDGAAYGFSNALPDGFDPEVWASAVRFELAAEPVEETGDFEPGLVWTQASADAPARLADLAFAYFRDPQSAGIAVLDPALLPAAAAKALGGPVEREHTGHRPRRARAVLEELAAHPRVLLDTWPTGAVPAWRASGGGLVAVHVPNASLATTGEPLELVVTSDAKRKAVGILVTTADEVALLPGYGDAGVLAAAVEHEVWHHGHRATMTGLGVPRSTRLVEVLDAVLQGAGTATIPWQRLAALVGEHPEHCLITTCPTRREPADR